MKKIFLVTYDFKTGQVPEGFFDVLKQIGPWWHYINGTWLILTELTATAIQSELQRFLSNNVHLLIVEMGHEMSGWLPNEAWEWINKNRSIRQRTGTFGASG